MNALLRLINLGRSARDASKIKVRQPLAELKIQPANDLERIAIERFAGLITDELNLKKVSVHDPAQGSLVSYEVKPNPKVLGPKLGQKLGEVTKALGVMNHMELGQKFQTGQSVKVVTSDGDVTLDPADVWVMTKAQEGFSGLADRGTILALDIRVSEELKLEGLAREVIRQVQDCRKKANLEMEDRIELYLASSDAGLSASLAKHRDYIGTETLTTQWSEKPLGSGEDVKIEKALLRVELRKMG
jgi:isoleucyl-tRNA synthetase